MANVVAVQGQDHALLRRCRKTGEVRTLPVIAFVVEMVPGRFGAPLPDAIAATGDRLHDDSDTFDTAVRMPSGEVVDWHGEYRDHDEWVAAASDRERKNVCPLG